MVKEKGLEDYIVDELTKYGWRYVDATSLEREGFDKPLLYNVLRRKIREFNSGVSEDDVSETISLLEGRSYRPKGAREVIEYLKFGVPVKLSQTRTSARLKFIDYSNIGRNDFVVSKQVTHVGVREIRNDIVLYVNGVPLVNIEVKKPTDLGVSWRDAFVQIKRFEQDVPELYKYVQIGVAVEAVARYFPIVPWAGADAVPTYEWKEEGLDSIDSVIKMLCPERLLDILRFYLYFRMEQGRETKVLPRYMQYRAAEKIVERVLKRSRGESVVDRGLIWHWQGSGKTLTMVFAAMKIYWLLKDPMIFFVVDRLELQNQLYFENLTKLDLGPEVSPKLIDSIDRLKQVLSYNDYRGEPGLFVVMVHKFKPEEFVNVEKLLEAVSKTKPNTVMNRNDVIMLVDEAHRTQYGVLAEQMMRLLRSANYFAFTGTPVPRKNPLQNTFAKFSPPNELYLDKYFIPDSIDNGYTVKIAYQPGPFDYKLERKLLDEFLESEFDELPEEVRKSIEKSVVKELDVQKYKVFLENQNRIERIAEYIAKHFKENVDGRFKAIVVAASRRACVLYKRALDKYLQPEYSGVVMTFQNQEEDELIEEYRRELMRQHNVTDPRDVVQKVIERFRIDENPRILIVTDMLLTGFDAPVLQTMYLDKPLKGHRLLQAIARVNRPYREVKEYGLIIDFIGMFDELEKAFIMYESEDLRGAVFDIDSLLNMFRSGVNELLQLVDPRPHVESEEELFKCMKNRAEKLAKDKELERNFIGVYRVLRRLYDLIAPKLAEQERKEYEWLSDIYLFYTKNFKGKSSEEEMVNKYYRKTVEAISQTFQTIEKESKFSPLTIDRKFFEEFIQNNTISNEEKSSDLLMGVIRFKLYAQDDPVYISVADKIETIIDEWRKKLRTSLELYEEAKKLWEEIYVRKEEQTKLQFNPREYITYRTLVDNGFEKRDAEEIAKNITEKTKNKTSIKEWYKNPKLVKDIERITAHTILRYARKYNLSKDNIKKLIDLVIERMKKNGGQQ